MKKFSCYLLVLCLVLGCSKKGEKGTAVEAILVGSSWQTYKYFRNGVESSTMENRVPIFTFKKDSLNVRLINPYEAETFVTTFQNEQNFQIKSVTNPGQRPYNLKVDSLEGSHFHFTISNGAGGGETYWTVKL
jgi:hypothetical protein